MLGAITGDIIGSVYEFNNIKSTDFPLFSPESRFTDDSVLTIALAEAILKGKDYAETIRSYYFRYPSAGYGGRFKRWATCKHPAPYNSYGNGAAMRISPVGWLFNTVEEVLEQAEKYTSVTHNHPEGVKGAQAVAAAIYLCRSGASKDELKDWLTEQFGYDLTRSCDQIRPGYSFDVSCQGTVPEALAAFFDSSDFETAIRLAISLGGDSDTLACITGSIAEAFYGGLPEGIRGKALSYLDQKLLYVYQAFEKRYQVGLAQTGAAEK